VSGRDDEGCCDPQIAEVSCQITCCVAFVIGGFEYEDVR
jgi:hypothetical protein